MDKIKGIINDLKDGGATDNLDVNSLLGSLNPEELPLQKDKLVSFLEEKGLPDQVIDRIREVDTTEFDSVDEIRSKLGI